MSLVAEKGVITAPLATGNQTYNLGSAFNGILPKFIILWTDGTTTPDTMVADATMFMGVGTYDGSAVQQWYQSLFGDAGVDPSSVCRGRNTTAILKSFTSRSLTPDAVASLVSFNAGTPSSFVLNWSDAPAAAIKVHYLVVGGTDITKARTGAFNLLATGTPPVAQDVTIASGWGKPDFLLLSAVQAAVGDALGNGLLNLAAAKSDSARISSFVGLSDASASAAIAHWQKPRAVLVAGAAGAVDAEAELDVKANYPTDGFRLIYSDVAGSAFNGSHFYLALQGTFQSAVGTGSTLTSGSTQDNACGFVPICAGIFGGNQPTNASAITAGTGVGAWGMGGTDFTNEGWAGFSVDDALATNARYDSRHSQSKILVEVTPETPTVEAEADASVNGTNFRLTYSNLDSAAREYGWWALGAAPLPPTATSVARVSLASAGTPVTRTAHSIKVRARKASGSGTVILKAALYEGGTNRSGDLSSSALTTSFADYTLSISDAAAANITSYSDLEIRFWATCVDGNTVDVDVAKISLEIPETSGPTTHYGATSSAITFGKAVSGTRTTFGQVARPITFGKAVAGARTVFGQIALPIIFSKAVAGSRTAFGQVARSITFGKAVAGGRTTFGQVARPITFGKEVVGRRTTFSQISFPITFGKEVIGRRTTFSQVARPITFGKEVVGRRTTFGQTTLPIIFSKSVVGRKHTFGQITFPITIGIATIGIRPSQTFFGATSLPLTFGKDVAGRRTTFGQVARPIIFSKDVVGRRTTFSQISFPIIFSKSVTGRKHTFGQITFPITFGKAVSGRRTALGQITFPITVGIATAGFKPSQTFFGAISLPLTFGKDVVGRRTTHGQVALPIIFGKSVSGRRTTFGQITFPIIFGKSVVGQRTALGQIAFPIIFGKSVSGRRTTFSQISLPIIFSKQVTGQRRTFGQTSLPIIFSRQIIGQRRTFGQISLPIIFSKSVIGRVHTFGRTSLPITLSIFVNGNSSVGPQQYFGALSLPLTFGKNVLGVKRTFASVSMPLIFSKEVLASKKTFGQLTAPFIFQATTQSQRQTFSTLDLPIIFEIQVGSGHVGLFGAIDLDLILAIQTAGLGGKVGITLNDALSLYLGETEIQAVYVGSEKVWES